MSVLLEKILLGVRNLEIKQERFDVVKGKVRKAYKNFDYRDPYRQINVFSRMLISERSWAPFQMLEELPVVTTENMRSYFPALLRQMHIEILVHGNMYKEDALSITKPCGVNTSPTSITREPVAVTPRDCATKRSKLPIRAGLEGLG